MLSFLNPSEVTSWPWDTQNYNTEQLSQADFQFRKHCSSLADALTKKFKFALWGGTEVVPPRHVQGFAEFVRAEFLSSCLYT